MEIELWLLKVNWLSHSKLQAHYTQQQFSKCFGFLIFRSIRFVLDKSMDILRVSQMVLTI